MFNEVWYLRSRLFSFLLVFWWFPVCLWVIGLRFFSTNLPFSCRQFAEFWPSIVFTSIFPFASFVIIAFSLSFLCFFKLTVFFTWIVHLFPFVTTPTFPPPFALCFTRAEQPSTPATFHTIIAFSSIIAICESTPH